MKMAIVLAMPPLLRPGIMALIKVAAAVVPKTSPQATGPAGVVLTRLTVARLTTPMVSIIAMPVHLQSRPIIICLIAA